MFDSLCIYCEFSSNAPKSYMVTPSLYYLPELQTSENLLVSFLSWHLLPNRPPFSCSTLDSCLSYHLRTFLFQSSNESHILGIKYHLTLPSPIDAAHSLVSFSSFHLFFFKTMILFSSILYIAPSLYLSVGLEILFLIFQFLVCFLIW